MNPLGRLGEAEKRRKVIAAMEAQDRDCFMEDLDAAQEISLQPANDAFGGADISGPGVANTRQDLEAREEERDVLHNYRKKSMGKGGTKGFFRPRASKTQPFKKPQQPRKPQKPQQPRNSTTTAAAVNEEPDVIDMDWTSFEDDLDVSNDFCFISSMQLLQETEAVEFARWEDDAKARIPDTIENVFTQQNNTSDSLEGDAIVDLWFLSLAKIEAKINLSQQQKDFIHCCFLSLLPLIYGDQFEPNIVRLCKRFNIDAMYKKVFFEMPRRFGKTTSVSIVAGLCTYVLKKKVNGEGNTIGIFSVVKSASDSITESSIGYYEVITGRDPKDFIDSWDKQKGRVVMFSYYGDKNIIWGFSAVSNVRMLPHNHSTFLVLVLPRASLSCFLPSFLPSFLPYLKRSVSPQR
jgi:hypothetical protein